MKKKISVLVLWRQNRDENMYPHMYDFLNELEKYFDEVIYKNINISYFDFYGFDDILNKKIKEHKNISFEALWLLKKKRELKKTYNQIKEIRFRNSDFFIIGVDYLAFFLGKTLFKKNVMFYSYDFIDKDSYVLKYNGVTKFLYDYAVENINKSLGVIIQDYNRGKEFEKSLGININNFIYLPVCLNDNEYCIEMSEKIINKNLNNQDIKLTQIGDVKEGRNYEKLISRFESLTAQYSLYINGRVCSEKIKEQISKCKKTIFVKSVMIKSGDVAKKISNYDIGFISYEEQDSNYKFLERASGQLIEFLRIGMPIILIGPKNFINYVNNNKIGVGFQNDTELADSINIVCNNYKQMAYNSRKKFEEEFCLETNFKRYFVNDIISLYNMRVNKSNDVKIKILLKNLFNYQYVILNPLVTNPFLKIINIYFSLLKNVLQIKTNNYIDKVKKVAIFGTGDLSNIYFEELNQKNIEVVYFLDSSEEKIGKTFNGRIIKDLSYLLEDGYNEIDGIILASNERKLEMWSEVKKVGFKKYIIFNI